MTITALNPAAIVLHVLFFIPVPPSDFFYPLMAPAIVPLTIYFCVVSARIIAGIIAITPAAARDPDGVSLCVCTILAIPMGRVFFASEDLKDKRKSKLIQALQTSRIAMTGSRNHQEGNREILLHSPLRQSLPS